MSRNLIERLLSTLITTGATFIAMLLFQRFIFEMEDWILISAVYSISWGLGQFISQNRDILGETAYFNIVISIIGSSVGTLFVTAIQFKIPLWQLSTPVYMILGFILSCVHTNWISNTQKRK